MSHKKYALFVGRFSPPHNGHIWLIGRKLTNGTPVLIAIRDTPYSENDPYSASFRKSMLEAIFREEIQEGQVRVIILPDIESINYGRGVGYAVEEHEPPSEVAGISATELRRCLREEDTSWRERIPEAIWEMLE